MGQTVSQRAAGCASRWLLGWVTLMMVGPAAGEAIAQPPVPSGAAILEQLRAFQEMGSVLHVAAHPDDENTQLITYLARGRRVRAAYLSITRGDGGQNVLGPEFDEELGLIRTHELLAARRLDGGRQFFTRAIDFGYSKDPQETLKTWDGQQALGDVVRVIRTFQPDVIVTRFNPQATRTHGHHTASAILAVEAFKVCGDPQAFPEQLKDLQPWQPKRVLINGAGGGRGGAETVQLDVGGNDVLLNESFAAIAGRSRAMHKSQGFGNFGGRGGGGGGPRSESFQILAGEPAKSDIFDGIDVTWSRVPGGAEIGRLIAEVIAKFQPADPGASVKDLLALHRKLAALPAGRLVDEKRIDFDRILQACLGLTIETAITRAEACPGDFVAIDHSLCVKADVPIRWTGVRYPSLHKETKQTFQLLPGQYVNSTQQQVLPDDMPLSQPYWLRQPPGVGLYTVAEASLIGQPAGPAPLAVEHLFDVDGETLVIPSTPMAKVAEDGKWVQRPFEVVAPISLRFEREVATFAPGTSRPVKVTVTSKRNGVTGELKLAAPADWKITPPAQTFQIATMNESASFTFNVTPPAQAASASLVAQAVVAGRTYDTGRIEIRYDHIGPLLLQPTARLKAVALDLAIRGKQLGYVAGAGDSVAECLQEMGYTVKQLAAADLTAEGLRGLDAVVIGVRAFNVRDDLAAHMPALFAFAEAGGNLIVQYNRPEGLKSNKFAPYDLRLSGERVTDEQSPVNFLLPDHPALNTPNKIAKSDFDDWVQERGIYFPNQWDEHFTPILEFKDPGEPPLKGGILIAPHGKGHVIYTSLVWFRELPAGVPGAYRLFANLTSLGKD